MEGSGRKGNYRSIAGLKSGPETWYLPLDSSRYATLECYEEFVAENISDRRFVVHSAAGLRLKDCYWGMNE